jgi:hypothetical protein
MEQIVAVAERLAEVSALQSESTRHLLEEFTWCSVSVFKHAFAHLLVAEQLQQLHYLSNQNGSTHLNNIKMLCREANNLFNAFWLGIPIFGSNFWDPPSEVEFRFHF